jgi:hypothetical protein
MHFGRGHELYAGSADVPSATRRQARSICQYDWIIFALRAQCGRDVRVPSNMRRFLILHHDRQGGLSWQFGPEPSLTVGLVHRWGSSYKTLCY